MKSTYSNQSQWYAWSYVSSYNALEKDTSMDGGRYSSGDHSLNL